MAGVHKFPEEVRRYAVNRVAVDKVHVRLVASEIGVARVASIYEWATQFGVEIGVKRPRKRLHKKSPEPEQSVTNMGESRLWRLSGEMCSALGTDRGAELVREYLELRKVAR